MEETVILSNGEAVRYRIAHTRKGDLVLVEKRRLVPSLFREFVEVLNENYDIEEVRYANI